MAQPSDERFGEIVEEIFEKERASMEQYISHIQELVALSRDDVGEEFASDVARTAMFESWILDLIRASKMVSQRYGYTKAESVFLARYEEIQNLLEEMRDLRDYARGLLDGYIQSAKEGEIKDLSSMKKLISAGIKPR